MKIRVYYEDTDAGGIVYHANYLKFCERARSELFFSKGLSPHSKSGFFVLRRIEADFFKSASLGDVLEVTTEVEAIKKASVIFWQTVWLKDEPIFQARVLLAYLANGRVGKIPEPVLALLKALPRRGES